MAKKTKSGYSPAYEKRLKSYFEKNPYGTMAEARGHKINPPDTKDSKKLTEFAIREKIKIEHVKEKLGLITAKQKKENVKGLQDFRFFNAEQGKYDKGDVKYWELHNKAEGEYKKLEEKKVLGPRDEDELAALIFYHH